MFDTDLFLPIIDTAASILGVGYGADPATDVALRVLADHGRAFSMLVADGVLPANEGRGYVLRRVVRRAVLAARRAGVEKPVGAKLVEAATAVLGDAYPALRAQQDLIVNVIAARRPASTAHCGPASADSRKPSPPGPRCCPATSPSPCTTPTDSRSS